VGKGWVEAHSLQPGDLLCSRDGSTIAVEEAYDTGEYETVYNCRVAGWHTYFVGCDEWGFSVWAHNTYSRPEMQAEVAGMLQKLGYDAKAAAKIAKQYAKDGRLGDGIHANLKAYIDAGGEGFTAAGAWTRPANNRLPKGGVWTGQKGHSDFIPDNPAALGLNAGEVVPFRFGRPDFSKWSKGNYTAKETLTGFDDVDRPIFERTLRDAFKAKEPNAGWTLEKVRDWLRNEQYSPHHSGGNEFQLIPWKLHGNPSAVPPINGLRHSGGAEQLRGG
jgi:hypothetical protein